MLSVSVCVPNIIICEDRRDEEYHQISDIMKGMRVWVFFVVKKEGIGDICGCIYVCVS